jgi:hypothetical protein
VRISFDSEEEFLEEFASSEPLPGTPVRMTFERAQDASRLGLYHLILVATYVTECSGVTAVVEYRGRCGSYAHAEGLSREAVEQKAALAGKIREFGYPISGGRYN